MPKLLSPLERKKRIHCLFDEPCFYCGGENYNVAMIPIRFPVVEDGVKAIRRGLLHLPFCFDCYQRITSGEPFEELADKIAEEIQPVE